MIELLLFILIGVIMYLVQRMVGPQFGWRKVLIYLISGMIGGLGAVLLAKYSLPSQVGLLGKTIWPGMVIMGSTGGIVLYTASALNLYQSNFFQLFGTLILGIATGVGTVAIYALYAVVVGIPWITTGQIGNRHFSGTIIMFCVLGFLIIFGYTMTARIVTRLHRALK
ncbi:hypothetical protein DRQ00_02910 [candidate division KSB1 bacterium]|nr:MAG: hypothetical protein DRQ00_02910 [candidate division KSB1 bacterium]